MTAKEFILQLDFPKTGSQIAQESAMNGINGIVEALQELVQRGELKEIEYFVEGMGYRVKSIYFPKNWIIDTVEGRQV
jgi:hypothetical protein